MAEISSLSEQTVYRIEKGTPVSRKSIELVFEGMRQPVFSYYTDQSLRVTSTKKAELIRRLLSSMRHSNNKLFISLFSQYCELEVPDNTVTKQYDAFFLAYKLALEDAKPRHICLSLLEALCLTLDVSSLLKKCCMINSNLGKSRSQARKECCFEMTSFFSPVLTEPELLIINLLACILCRLHDYDGAGCIFEALIFHLEAKLPRVPGWEYYVPTIYYNLAVCQMEKGLRSDSLDIIDKLSSFEDIYEDDLLYRLSHELRHICKSPDANPRPPLLTAFFRPTSYWATVILATFLETETLNKLISPEKNSPG